MNYRLLDFLRCPCSSGLALTNPVPGAGNGEIISGLLTCQNGHEWPIIGGIPRFVPRSTPKEIAKTQKTFSYEWKHFRDGERNWGQDISFRRNLFLNALGVSRKELQGKVILDAGCGSGALSIDMANAFGLEVVAIDLAYGVEKAYHRNNNPRVHFVQGSILDLPFANTYSITFTVLVCLFICRTPAPAFTQ